MTRCDTIKNVKRSWFDSQLSSLVCKMFIQFWLQNLEADVSKADSQSLSITIRSQRSEIVFFFRQCKVINSLRELTKTN